MLATGIFGAFLIMTQQKNSGLADPEFIKRGEYEKVFTVENFCFLLEYYTILKL